jgi:hypothetical protein
MMSECRFCNNDHYSQNGPAVEENAAEVILFFDSGRSYRIPAALPHLILAHDFKPPSSLVGDVMNSRHMINPATRQGKPYPIDVTEDFDMGGVPPAVPYRLMEFIKATSPSEAANAGSHE